MPICFGSVYVALFISAGRLDFEFASCANGQS